MAIDRLLRRGEMLSAEITMAQYPVRKRHWFNAGPASDDAGPALNQGLECAWIIWPNSGDPVLPGKPAIIGTSRLAIWFWSV